MLCSLDTCFLILALLLVSSVRGVAINEHMVRTHPCFPTGSAQLSGMTPPSQSRNDWWCKDSQHGFMGFSYALENSDCSDYSNSFQQINEDFARMKSQFGATMVRIYAPECRDETIWINLLRSGIENNMAVIPQVWWGFGDQSLWQQTRASILAVLNSSDYGPVSPYVFHSLAFGSEPIGDGVDGGNFVNDLIAMKEALQPYGIPITISEDWDRPDTMSNDDFTALGPMGEQIAPVIDLVQVHIMPYYRPDRFPTADNVWPYFEQYISFLKTNLPDLPILITQSPWSSQLGGTHDRGGGDSGENIGNFTEYWTTIEFQCQFFKDNNVGWFVHTYTDDFEAGFGMLDSNRNPKMSFSPPQC